MRNPDDITRHHIIAREKGGTWHPDNIVKLQRDTHDAVHLLFGNDLPFQIMRGINERYRTTMNGDAYELMNGVLLKVENTLDAYNPNCFNPEVLSRYFR